MSPAHAIALRVRCLATLFLRGHAEALKKGRSPGLELAEPMPADAQHALCQRALADSQLAGAFMPEERQVIKRPLGKLRVFEARAAVYAADALDVLAWALHAYELEDQLPDRTYVVTTPEGAPGRLIIGPDLAPWLTAPRLRPEAELLKRCAIEEVYAWRLRVHILTLTVLITDDPALRPKVKDLIAAQVARKAAECERRGLFQARENDLPYADTTAAVRFEKGLMFSERAEQEVNQRLRAAAWMLNPAMSWDSTDADSPMGFEVPKHLQGPEYENFIAYHFNPPTSVESFRHMR